MVLYYCVLKRTKGGKGRTFLFPGCFMMVIVLCVMKEDVKGWRLESHGHEGKSQGMKKNERMKWGTRFGCFMGTIMDGKEWKWV